MIVSVDTVQREYEARQEKVESLAMRYGIRASELSAMARLFGWRRRCPAAVAIDRRRWTDDEEAVLRAEYSTADIDELAARLCRRRIQVLRKADALGLKRERGRNLNRMAQEAGA